MRQLRKVLPRFPTGEVASLRAGGGGGGESSKQQMLKTTKNDSSSPVSQRGRCRVFAAEGVAGGVAQWQSDSVAQKQSQKAPPPLGGGGAASSRRRGSSRGRTEHRDHGLTVASFPLRLADSPPPPLGNGGGSKRDPPARPRSNLPQPNPTAAQRSLSPPFDESRTFTTFRHIFDDVRRCFPPRSRNIELFGGRVRRQLQASRRLRLYKRREMLYERRALLDKRTKMRAERSLRLYERREMLAERRLRLYKRRFRAASRNKLSASRRLRSTFRRVRSAARRLLPPLRRARSAARTA